MPTYQPNIPTGTVKLLQDYLNLQGNFQQLDIAYGVNHVPFSDTSGVPPGGTSGLHKFVQMPVQTLPAIQAGQGAVYTKTAGQSQLFYTSDSLPSNNLEYQLTRVIDASYSLFSTFVNNYNSVGPAFTGGWTFLPGGLLLQYGTYATPLAGPTDVPFPVVFTNPPYIVELTARNDGSHSAFIYYIEGAPTTTKFTFRGSATGSETLFWVALGK